MGSIQLKNVIKSFGDLQVIKPLNLHIKEGEFIVFVGPSGCGKSTLLRTIAGLEDVTSGTVHIDGVNCTDTRPALRQLAMVFQSYALYPHMSVRKNIAFPLKMVGMNPTEINQKVEGVADILNLTQYLDRRPGQLSGGQRQRVAIGRAIVRQPKAFLFDEPLSNLDASLRVNMRLEIAELHKTLKSTMIYVTHDQVEAMTMADRIVVLRDGVIEQVGTPLELYNTPNNTFVAGFIGSPKMNFITGQWANTYQADTLGIRPEHLSITSNKADWTGVVQVSEHLGSDTYLHIVVDGVGKINVRSSGNLNVHTGDTVHIAIDPARVYRFDKDGNSITINRVLKSKSATNRNL